MQKIFHALFLSIIFFNGAVSGMETLSEMEREIISEIFEQGTPWSNMSFHDQVLYLIQVKKVNYQGAFGVTHLFMACHFNYLEDIKLLINAHAKVDMETYAGCTPLHIAAINGHLQAVKLLLAADANAHWENYRGYTPLQEAQKARHMEIAKLLQEQMSREQAEWRKERLAKRKSW